MFILLNGSFGIGKTTTAALLAQTLPDAAIFDPESVGYVLRRTPAWLLGLRRQPEDYQDMALWRRLIGVGGRLTHRRAAIVIVPMAFTNLAYLDAFAKALERKAPVRRLCLVAPLELVRLRLQARAEAEGRTVGAFELQRSAECVSAHRDPAYGLPIDATGTPTETLRHIRAALDL